MSVTDGLHCEHGGDLLTSSLAVFESPAKVYRYLLTRRWGGGWQITWVMLNPSIADAFSDDPTIVRLMKRARGMPGCGALAVVNLFALRATDPGELSRHAGPVGEANDAVIAETCAAADGPVVAAWGAHEFAAMRAREVAAMLAAAGVRLQCLGAAKKGQPLHPLYLPYSAELAPWPGGGPAASATARIP